MRGAGNEPVWITCPGVGHGFAAQTNRVDFAGRIERILALHLCD
jgi:hypothetical protein